MPTAHTGGDIKVPSLLECLCLEIHNGHLMCYTCYDQARPRLPSELTLFFVMKIQPGAGNILQSFWSILT